MTTPAPQPPPPPAPPSLLPDRTLRDLDLGCRIGFLVLTALLAYVAIRLSWSFSPHGLSQKVFAGMLKGSPLPSSFKLVNSIQDQLLPLSVGLPLIAGIVALTVRRSLTALLIIAGCNLALALLSILIGTAMMDMFGQIIQALS